MASDGALQLRVYAVDDEGLALRNLVQMLEKSDGVELLGHSTDPQQALHFLAAHPVDLLFLDIHMPGLDGFGFLDKLQEPPAVVFTTAYDQYAVQAFQADAIDYLLKPVCPDDLARAIEKAAKRLGNTPETAAGIERFIARHLGHLRTTPVYPTRVTSRVGNRIRVIDLNQVTHFVSEGNLTYAVTPDTRYVVDISLAALDQRLDPTGFLRIHRATIVNLSWIEEVHTWFGGRLLIRLKRGAGELKVARDRARVLKDSLGL
jgi:two-component system, LytTR family, response regulator